MPTNGSLQRGGAPVCSPGVGSNRTQPEPSKYSSGQACDCLAGHDVAAVASDSPGRKPTATRAGMPSVRAMIVIEVANCTQ